METHLYKLTGRSFIPCCRATEQTVMVSLHLKEVEHDVESKERWILQSLTPQVICAILIMKGRSKDYYCLSSRKNNKIYLTALM